MSNFKLLGKSTSEYVKTSKDYMAISTKHPEVDDKNVLIWHIVDSEDLNAMDELEAAEAFHFYFPLEEMFDVKLEYNRYGYTDRYDTEELEKVLAVMERAVTKYRKAIACSKKLTASKQ